MVRQVNSDRTPTVIVIAAAVVALGVLVMYGVLAIRGALDDTTVSVVLAVLAAVLPTIAGQVATHARLRTVERQTGAEQSRLVDVIEHQSDHLAWSQPPEPAPPQSAEDYPPAAGRPE